MKTRPRIIAASVLAFAVVIAIGIRLSASTGAKSQMNQKMQSTSDRLIVHEWGTFTSIAGKDGIALEWRPLNGPSDLPKFVHTLKERSKGLRHAPSKLDPATVRMETPVLYFYSGKEMEVDVKVAFPQGKITEWYPQARFVAAVVDWGRIKIMPGAAMNLPVENSESHYYPARETDAAPVQVCGTDGQPTQQEKFLFYRGIGTFGLPISVKLEGDKLVFKNLGKDEISHLVVFENRGGKIGYRLIDAFTGELSYARPALDANLDSVLQDLKQILVASGLYLKEAEAMIKTWRSSWFEEGMRVFYILPRPATDAVLPLTIAPQPTELVRVLVGRTEVITPEMEKSVKQQVSLLGDSSPQVRDAARQNIRKYGRFSEPILKRILESERDTGLRERIRELINQAGEESKS
jgi:hypothetical protein